MSGDRQAPLPSGAGTRAVHAGEHQPSPHRPAVQPIYQTAPFTFESTDELAAGFEGAGQEGLYSRYANPTVRVVEEKLAALEGADDAVAFSSGMAAISGLLGTLLRTGDRLIAAADIYGGTTGWLAWLTTRHPQVAVEWVSLESLAERIESESTRGLRAVYVETPTNPLMRVCDLARIGAACHGLGAPLIVDNTFATPILQRPLELGATYAVHSATKYLGGHSDVTAGLVAGPAEPLAAVRATLRLGGGCLDPHAAFLLARGMRTLPLRIERQSANASRLAQALAEHPRIDQVYYPGNDPVARRQMRSGGAMLAFDVTGGLAAATAFLDRLRLIRIMPSLGGLETGAVLPAITSHKGLTPSERQALGIGDGLIRLSVGIESVADLEADLVSALEARV